MKDHERDELFARARREVAPTDDDRRRVRMALTRKLGVAAAVSVGATATKAAASASPTVTAAAASVTVAATNATVAATGLTAATIAKVSALVLAAVAVGFATIPANPSASTTQSVVVSAPALTVPRETLPLPSPRAVVVSPALTEPIVATPSSHESQTNVPPTREVPPMGPAVGAATRGGVERPTPANEAPVVAVEPPATAASAAPSSGVATDGREVSLIGEMQVALRAGETARVLALVKEHERLFPASAWTPEREGARVLAECPGKGADEARILGQNFVAAHPQSPLGARVRVMCGIR